MGENGAPLSRGCPFVLFSLGFWDPLFSKKSRLFIVYALASKHYATRLAPTPVWLTNCPKCLWLVIFRILAIFGWFDFEFKQKINDMQEDVRCFLYLSSFSLLYFPKNIWKLFLTKKIIIIKHLRPLRNSLIHMSIHFGCLLLQFLSFYDLLCTHDLLFDHSFFNFSMREREGEREWF